MKTNKKRLMVIGQGDSSTGFARVLNSVLPFLSQTFSVHHFALNYRGAVKQINEDYVVYPNMREGDVHGREQLGALLETIRPDIVWMLQDAWYFQVLEEEIRTYKHPLKVVAYSAIDNEALSASDFRNLDFIDEYIVFTHFAKDLCDRLIQQESLKMPEIKVIPHGVNTHLFYPLSPNREEARMMARSKLFADSLEHMNDFIVLNANRNQYRKRIDTTIAGFALLAQHKPDVKLYLHMGLKKIGYDIPGLVKQAGIEDKVIYTGEHIFHPLVSDEQLNLIYNACDAGLNTAGAEGWGLVSFEHAAAGVAQIVPQHSACAEIWKDAALMMQPLSAGKSEPVESYELSPEEVSHALELLYKDRQLLQRTASACYARATHPDYNWKQIAARFEQIFLLL